MTVQTLPSGVTSDGCHPYQLPEVTALFEYPFFPFLSLFCLMLSFFRKLGRVMVRMKGGAKAAVSEPFESSCECGATVTGMRRTTWIEAECQSCFQSVFILPGNVYPTTKRVTSSVLSGGFLSRLKVVVEEVFPKKERAKPATEVVTATDAQPAVVTATKPRFRWPDIDIVGMLRRTFTPFRLLMMAVMMVVGLTGYWMIHQRSVEAAQQTWIRASDDVETLLQDRKLASLETVLAEAVDAGMVLGKRDSEWRGFRNLLDETRAVSNMAQEDLLTAFHDAYDVRMQLVDGAEESVRTATESGTYIFESWLRRDPDDANMFLVEFPATPGQNPVEVRVLLPAINELVETLPDSHVLFAGTIDSATAPKRRTRNPWKLTIDPASFILLTSVVHCEEIGLPTENDDELSALLDRQREFVTSSTTWESRAESIVSSEEDAQKQESSR